MWKKLSSIVLIGLALLTACRKDEKVATPTKGTFTLTLQATKRMDTKALNLSNDGKTLSGGWKSGETVSILADGNVIIGTLTAQETGRTTTLSGTVSKDDLTENMKLYLLLPSEEWYYTHQKGSFETVSDFDFATATVTVDTIEGESVTLSTASIEFQSEQSIYRFGFSMGDEALKVKEVIIDSENGKLVKGRVFDSQWISRYFEDTFLSVTPGVATAEPLYVALRNDYTATKESYYFLVVNDDNDLYEGVLESKAPLANGHFYEATLDVNRTYLNSYSQIKESDPNNII